MNRFIILLENHEVTTGVVIFVLSVVVSVFGFFLKKIFNKRRNLNTSVKTNNSLISNSVVTTGDRNVYNITTTNQGGTDYKKSKNVSKLSPEDILKQLESVPPFQQKEVSKNYSGIKVVWNVLFRSAYVEKTGDDGNNVRLILSPNNGYLRPLINCHVNINEYPELKVSKKNTKITIAGEILEVSTLLIDLKNVKLLKIDSSEADQL